MACVYERANRMKKTIFANFNGLHVHVKTATITKTATMQQTANICKNSAKNCTCLLEIGKYFSAMGASSYIAWAWSCFIIMKPLLKAKEAESLILKITPLINLISLPSYYNLILSSFSIRGTIMFMKIDSKRH